MKDFYNLESLDPIEDDTLMQLYKESKAALAGTITLWGDCIGRPGDNLYALKEITGTSEKGIVFEFKGAKIQVYNPRNIYVNEMIIAINGCDKIIWDDISFNTKIEYLIDKSDQKVVANIVRGEHHPNLNTSEPCFMLAAW